MALRQILHNDRRLRVENDGRNSIPRVHAAKEDSRALTSHKLLASDFSIEVPCWCGGAGSRPLRFSDLSGILHSFEMFQTAGARSLLALEFGERGSVRGPSCFSGWR